MLLNMSLFAVSYMYTHIVDHSVKPCTISFVASIRHVNELTSHIVNCMDALSTRMLLICYLAVLYSTMVCKPQCNITSSKLFKTLQIRLLYGEQAVMSCVMNSSTPQGTSVFQLIVIVFEGKSPQAVVHSYVNCQSCKTTPFRCVQICM